MNRDKKIGIITTIIFHTILLIALFVWGFPIPFPPPPEQGMLINFGTADRGSGNVEPMREAPNRTPQPVTASQPDVEDATATQDYEDAPVISKKEKKKPQKPKETPVPPVPVKEQAKTPPREVNKNALFPGQSAGADNRASGEGEGGPANQNQGALDGNPNAQNHQGSGAGNSFDLSGRSLSGTLPLPKYDIQEAGKVRVRIKVDRAGKVVEATMLPRGTTLTSDVLHNAAIQAALRAKFTPAAADAPMFQYGTIDYVFRMGNR
jgi:TonB family protein